MTACWACATAVDADVLDPSGYATCPRCGLRFFPAGVAPRDAYNEEYLVTYKGGDYLETEPVRRHEGRRRLELLSALAPRRGRLLEVGCATGFFLDEARHQGWEVVGVEPAEGAAEVARSRFGLDVRVGFAEDLDLGEAAYDAACAWHTLEHVPAPAALLEALRVTLRPGAPLAIEVPNAGSRRARQLGERWPALESDVHMGQWTPDALRLALETAGFTEVRTETRPFLTYVPGPVARFARRVKLAGVQRAWLPDPHPSEHELLRAVARRPR